MRAFNLSASVSIFTPDDAYDILLWFSDEEILAYCFNSYKMKLSIELGMAKMVLRIMPCCALKSLLQFLPAINMSLRDALNRIWARIVVYCLLLRTGPGVFVVLLVGLASCGQHRRGLF